MSRCECDYTPGKSGVSVIISADDEDSTTPSMGTDEQDALIDIPPTVSAGANVVGMHNYLAVWEKSVNDPQAFWMEQARLRHSVCLCASAVLLPMHA